MSNLWDLEQKSRRLKNEKKEFESLEKALHTLVGKHMSCMKRNQDAFADKSVINGDNICVKSLFTKMRNALNAGVSHSIPAQMSALDNTIRIELRRIQFKIDDIEHQIRICKSNNQTETSNSQPTGK